MEILSKVSGRLAELMKELDLSTPLLARQTGIDQSVIARILHAERMPSAKTLSALADFFACSTDYLLGLKDATDDVTFKQCPPFGEQLTFLLKHFNITKYRLEKDTRLSEKTVNRWHNGKTHPTAESLIRLSAYFGCSVDFLLGRV